MLYFILYELFYVKLSFKFNLEVDGEISLEHLLVCMFLFQ